jgi:hypothetical protein
VLATKRVWGRVPKRRDTKYYLELEGVPETTGGGMGSWDNTIIAWGRFFGSTDPMCSSLFYVVSLADVLIVYW